MSEQPKTAPVLPADLPPETLAQQLGEADDYAS